MNFQHITYLNVEVTNKCALECAHCSSSSSFSCTDYIEPDQVFSLVSEGKKLGASCLSISGGEPLLYPHLNEIIDYAYNLDFHIRLYTSGLTSSDGITLIPADNQVLNSLLDKINTIIFSLHSHVAAVHDQVTSKQGSFDLTTTAIGNAVETGMNCEIHTVPMSINYKDIPGLVMLGEELGVDRISFLRLVPQGRCVNNLHLMMNPSEIRQFMNILQHLDSPLLDIRKGAPYKCLFFENSGYCSAGVDKILVSADGSVHPCEAFKFLASESNINQQSLANIWLNDRLLKGIRNTDINSISTCSGCEMNEICRGGCPGQRYLAYDTMEIGPDPICLIENT